MTKVTEVFRSRYEQIIVSARAIVDNSLSFLPD